METGQIGQLIYVSRAAEMLCCSNKYIYDLIRDGKIEAVRLGKRGVRVSKHSVLAFIEGNKIDPVEYDE